MLVWLRNSTCLWSYIYLYLYIYCNHPYLTYGTDYKCVHQKKKKIVILYIRKRQNKILVFIFVCSCRVLHTTTVTPVGIKPLVKTFHWQTCGLLPFVFFSVSLSFFKTIPLVLEKLHNESWNQTTRFNLHEGFTPVRNCSSCYTKKCIQEHSFTHSTFPFLVQKAFRVRELL